MHIAELLAQGFELVMPGHFQKYVPTAHDPKGAVAAVLA